jgi:hypothetical protein
LGSVKELHKQEQYPAFRTLTRGVGRRRFVAGGDTVTRSLHALDIHNSEFREAG